MIDAKKEIYKQIKKYPNSSILYNILGAVLAEQNQLDKAITSYKKAIKINPKFATASFSFPILFKVVPRLFCASM